MGYLFTSESVSEGHPDKVADQISDAVLDKLLAYDPSSKVTALLQTNVLFVGESCWDCKSLLCRFGSAMKI